MEPNAEQLRKIGDLLEKKRLRTVVDTVLPLSEASAAYAGKVVSEAGPGKDGGHCPSAEGHCGNVVMARIVVARDDKRDLRGVDF